MASQAPEIETAKTEPPAAPPLDPAVFRVKSALEAITAWRVSMEIAAELKAAFERAWADALMDAHTDPDVAAGLKNDAARKAYADLQSNEAMLAHERAQAHARARGAIVDLFVGRGRQ
jgi:hypothetical protein